MGWAWGVCSRIAMLPIAEIPKIDFFRSMDYFPRTMTKYLYITICTGSTFINKYFSRWFKPTSTETVEDVGISTCLHTFSHSVPSIEMARLHLGSRIGPAIDDIPSFSQVRMEILFTIRTTIIGIEQISTRAEIEFSSSDKLDVQELRLNLYSGFGLVRQPIVKISPGFTWGDVVDSLSFLKSSSRSH
jgi:hypothetical protein